MAKMKFYQGNLARIVWDKDVGGAVAHFDIHGFFETDDEKIQKLLIKKGYLTEKDMDELRRTGTSAHGGFQRVVKDDKLPSGKPPIESEELRRELGAKDGKRTVREHVEVIDPGQTPPDVTAESENVGTEEVVETEEAAEKVKKRKRLKRSK